MLTGGHIAASYLLAKTANSFGLPLSGKDIVGVIIAGNIIDLDFFVGFITGKTGEAHHHNITHTPLGILIIMIAITLIFRPTAGFAIVIFSSMVLHLILDDIGYWLYKSKLMKAVVYPQINWPFPFTRFHQHNLMKNNESVLKYYLFNTWPVSLAEILLIIIASLIYIRSLEHI